MRTQTGPCTFTAESLMDARPLKIVAFTIMGLYTLFAVAMIYGDALTDPGGLKGFVMVFLPTLAFAGIALLDWRRPRVGRAVLIALAILGVGFHAAIGLGLLDRDVELGPDVSYVVLLFAFLPIPFFVLATLHARAQPGEAGVLMLVVGAIFMLGRPGVALALAAPAMIAGALFVASARRGGPKDTSPSAKPHALTG